MSDFYFQNFPSFTDKIKKLRSGQVMQVNFPRCDSRRRKLLCKKNKDNQAKTFTGNSLRLLISYPAFSTFKTEMETLTAFSP